jgi:hypothetical protein
MKAEGGRRTQPIRMNEEMPAGLVFKVQVGAFRNQLPDELFNDMTPVMGEDAGNGLTRYTAGLFTGFDQAFRAKDQIRERGYRDAFVVAYLDGKRIPLGEAMRAGRAADIAAAAPRTEQVQPAQVSGSTPTAQPAQPASSERIADGSTTRPGATGSNATDPAQGSAPTPERTAGRAIEPVVPNMPSAVPVTVPAAGVPAVQPTAEEEEKAILATYPTTAEEIIAQFAPAPDAVSYYPVSGVAPARPVEMIMGLFFTVQVGVYTKPVPLDKLYNITPLVSELTETAKIRYSTGVYLDMDAARERRTQIIEQGVKDAFVTAYLNGKRIPIRDARLLLEKYGTAILARP